MVTKRKNCCFDSLTLLNTNNDADVLTTNQLKSCLTHATNNGTRIAIFNSCDGLGLAHVLEKVGFSHIIVMSESIPDPVAQNFITFWLSEFAKGKSFYSTTRQAREQQDNSRTRLSLC